MCFGRGLLIGDGLNLIVLGVQNLRAICGCLVRGIMFRKHPPYEAMFISRLADERSFQVKWFWSIVLSVIIDIKGTLFSCPVFPDCLKQRHTLSDSSAQRGLLL